jgi:hypothetical protein
MTLSIIVVTFLSCYADCRHIECRYGKCHFAECHFTGSRYAECLGLVEGDSRNRISQQMS